MFSVSRILQVLCVSSLGISSLVYMGACQKQQKNPPVNTPVNPPVNPPVNTPMVPANPESPENLEIPLEKTDLGDVRVLDLVMHDAKRNRDIPVYVYLPPQNIQNAQNIQHTYPVILFSHGLGGSRKMGAFMGKTWADQGYISVFLQHAGSDVEVWRSVDGPLQKLTALKQAANGENLRLRVQDVHAALDQLTVWNTQKDHPLSGKMDLQHVGMAGHSFGAITTQIVGGQFIPPRLLEGFAGETATDPRIKAALILSPSPPKVGKPERAFGNVQIPWMLMTGTEDNATLVGGAQASERVLVYPALPNNGVSYELVLDGAQHSVFTDRALPTDKHTDKNTDKNTDKQQRATHHQAILKLSTAFWDAYLQQGRAGQEKQEERAKKAKQWLDDMGPKGAKSALQSKDRWQHK